MKKALLFLFLGMFVCAGISQAASISEIRNNIRMMRVQEARAAQEYYNTIHHKKKNEQESSAEQGTIPQGMQPPHMEGAHVKLKEGIWKNVARKFGGSIESARRVLNQIAGFTATTPKHRFALRKTTLVNAMKDVYLCAAVVQNQQSRYELLGKLQTLSQFLYAKFGSLEGVILHLETKSSQIKINTNYQSLIFQGSKNLFFLKKQAGAEALAQFWQTIDPTISYIPKTTDFEKLAVEFIATAIINLQKQQHIQASLCVLQCLGGKNIDFCKKCISGVAK